MFLVYPDLLEKPFKLGSCNILALFFGFQLERTYWSCNAKLSLQFAFYYRKEKGRQTNRDLDGIGSVSTPLDLVSVSGNS